jgi:hypothetical protein
MKRYWIDTTIAPAIVSKDGEWVPYPEAKAIEEERDRYKKLATGNDLRMGDDFGDDPIECVVVLKKKLAEKDKAPDFARGFNAGRNSVLRHNESGCCCLFNEDENIVSLCMAHKELMEEKDKRIAELETNNTFLMDYRDRLIEMIKELEAELASSKSIQSAEKAILLKEIEDHTKTKAELKTERDRTKVTGAVVRENRQLMEERDRLWEAASNLINDVHRRYPGEELKCQFMIALERALRGEDNGSLSNAL